MARRTRRNVLRGVGSVGVPMLVAGCSGNSNESAEENETPEEDTSETDTSEENTTEENTAQEDDTTEEEDEIDRPGNYRWDLRPERNEQLRDELGQYSEVDVGGLVEDHPAFEYSTDSERDNHGIDFNALRLYRESNYDILKESATEPMEELVEAFVNEDLFTEEKEGLVRHDTEAPGEYTSETWVNADSVADSLDLGHNLIATIDERNGFLDGDRTREQAAIIREAYQRHHDFDVLAWTTNMGTGSGYDDKITGLMYSPDDDKIRSYSPTLGDTSFATEGNRGMHTEIQDWPILEDDAEDFHPLLFHTDQWNRQEPGFQNAKNWAATTISRIASDTFDSDLINAIEGEHSERRGSQAPTTGLTKQLTRTALEYNENDANFQDLWDYANLTQQLFIIEGNYVLDTVEKDDNYEGVFDGGVAVYKVDDEGVVEDVWADKAGEYDNFGQNYDELKTSS